MLASNAWLRELTGLPLEPDDVARRLTSAGIEVEAVHHHGAGLELVVVAEVLAVRPHPKREKLNLVTVRSASGTQEVVCGAPNVPAPSGRVALAQLGAKLPGGLEIAARELAGVVSEGMLCSERELGIGVGEEGILVFDAATTVQVGQDLATALALRDTVYELSLTPNRADCLGHVGLARELCALYGAPFTPPSPRAPRRTCPATPGLLPQAESVFALAADQAGSAANTALPTVPPIRIDIADPARCPRYGAALVHGVTIAPSPFWLRYRLHLLGLRSISNVVDVTNYVLLLHGHPIHAFDHARLQGGRIAVRLAQAGERMKTLDGVERTLVADDLLICDANGPVALAGVMGGEGSEISGATSRVLIECAYFDPRSVRRTSKRTGLHTDSSHRFERGVDPSAVRRVLADAAGLIAELGGGTVVSSALDVVAEKVAPTRLLLRLKRAHALLGAAVEAERARGLLTALGCEVTAGPGEGELAVVVPLHRPDLGREIDLIEELARLVGYDTLPTLVPRLAASAVGTDPSVLFLRRLRESAAAVGLIEAVNYAFLASSDLRAARASQSAVRMINPMSEERSVLRTSLLPGLAANLKLAQSHQLDRFAGFEVARVFHPCAGQLLPDERWQLGLLLWGERRDSYAEGQPFDFYDAKAMLEAVVRPLCGRQPATVLDDALEADAPELHPRRRARVELEGQRVGCVGELHPDVASDLGLLGRPIWARLDVAALTAVVAALGPPRAQALPRFPAVTRDLAIVVAEATAAGEVQAALRAAGGAVLERVSLFDVYRGAPVESGHKSLAFHLVYRDGAGTLTDKVVDELHGKLQRSAEQAFGAAVRR